MKVTWPGTFFVLERSKVRNSGWHGTLLEDKRDDAGTYYRRNRYYDPATNRFTQEDPIGLAGGLNAYGFADGDPVTYSDPYGLCPNCDRPGLAQLSDTRLYATRDDAARAALSQAYGPSVAVTSANPIGLEYGGEIIRDQVLGLYTYTSPRTNGAAASVTINSGAQGFDGWYHSHGANSNGQYNDNDFSRADKGISDSHGKPGYLVTPSGAMKRYDPDPTNARMGPVTLIGQI